MALFLPVPAQSMPSRAAAKNRALYNGGSDEQKGLKLGLPICVAAAAAALYSYAAGGVGEPPQVNGKTVPVDCSHARGVQGSDFAPQSNSICLMPQASFRRLYPEIAQHTAAARASRIRVPAAAPGCEETRTQRLPRAALRGLLPN
jgi:hypothetical protein